MKNSFGPYSLVAPTALLALALAGEPAWAQSGTRSSPPAGPPPSGGNASAGAHPVLPAIVGAPRPASRPGPPWWKDDAFKKELGLTAEQSGHIDAIFQATLPQLRQGYDELDRLENKLSRLIEAGADETIITQAIDKMEAARSSLNKARTLMHVHMRQVLTSEQRTRFVALFEKRQQDNQQQATTVRHPS